MELAHSLLLNEEAFTRISDSKRPVFIFEWLRFLDKVLVAAQKSDIKESQKKLIAQLTDQISQNPGPPTRKLLARCLATIFSVGDTFSLFETINKCNDIIRNKTDAPSYLPTRLAAVACIGGMYEKLGRMVGRSYEETVQLLIKALRNAESQGRCEIMLTLAKVVAGIGGAGSNCYKEIYRAARNCMTDRSLNVRSAAAKCMYELVNEAPFVSTTELENVASLCFRSLDGSNYDVRCDVARVLGNLIATSQKPKPPGQHGSTKVKQLRLEEALAILSSGFLRGGTGFLRSSAAGEMIKGSGNINREVRVGVTHSYVEFVREMGGMWLERNLAEFLTHVLGLVGNPRACPSHVDAVYARKCVLFILRSVIGGVLGEKAQISAAKEICQVVIRQMNTIDLAAEQDKSAALDTTMMQHTLVCALGELGCLVETLGTSASPLVSEPSVGIIEPVVSVLIHPTPAARLAAAWCLRSIAVALPSQMTILIERCMTRMHHLKSSPEAVSGYSFALAALLGGVRYTALGIPHAKGKQIFTIAEELLRTASQNSRLSLQRTQSGWLLLGALMTLGPSVVRNHLPRMLLLWRNAFPRSTKELESEKARGDAFTWQVTLEGRAGALGAMESFVNSCPELVTEDVIRRLLPPLECALTLTAHIPSIMKMYGAHLKASAAMVRLRLYDVLALLPPETFEGAFGALLRELVAEFTLTDNPANTTTSLLRSMCHVDDSVILGSWLQETDHKAIEDQLEPNRKLLDNMTLQPNSASGSGALEHDPASLYRKCPQGEPCPGPLPLGVAVIDSSVRLYGQVFPRVAYKHRLQMLQHFNECIKQAKSSRQQAMQINIFTAVLCALKGLAETKTGFGQVEVRKSAVNLVLGALGSSNPILRCAAGEALGRMAQVVAESKFVAEMAQYSFDKLKSARDVVTRTGHSLALGCLHRYVGGMGSGQHLNTSVSILLALAQDSTSPVVQVWALHALALIADSGGPMFRSYVEPTLSLVLQLLLSVPPSHVDVHECLGKCLAALITTIGPELQGNQGSIATARLSCLVCCAVMQDHPDSMVQAEAISCLQQLHLFAPRHVNLTTLVPHLCETLHSSHLLLRRAAVACLRQLAQREAREVCEYALTLAGEAKDHPAITETGLEGALFGLLDTEGDRKLISDVQDTLVSMLQALAADNLTRWLLLIKDVLQATSESSALNSPVEEADTQDKDDDAGDDDDEILHGKGDNKEAKKTVQPRWPTRVFAIQCLLRIMSACTGIEEHFEFMQAKALKLAGKGDYLVLHLSELVRMAFIAATSDSDKLRLAGLAALDEIIDKFAKSPEPEFPGHVILEQYQAQVGAALRPAFTPETAPDVTAAACDVCSRWIGSGVARDLNDLRRVHQLLVSSLAKLKHGKDVSPLFSESASTMEKLAVLKAWAEVYIVAMGQEHERQSRSAAGPEEEAEESEDPPEPVVGESLLSLVQPEMVTLSKHWLAALKDHALLSLPSEYSSQLPGDGGAFYTSDTMDTSRPHYKKAWPSILYAASLWLKETGFTNVDKDDSRPANMKADESDTDRFHLLLGICVEALCSPTSIQPLSTVNLCLRAIYTLLDDPWPRSRIGTDQSLAIELLNVLHRLLLTRDTAECFLLQMKVCKQVIKAAQESVESQRTQQKELSARAEEEGKPTSSVSSIVGEGGENGDILAGKSLVFASLEVCLCVLVRHIPALNPSLPAASTQGLLQPPRLNEATTHLVCSAISILADLPPLCSPAGSVAILPTILFLVTGVIRECGTEASEGVTSPCVAVALQCLKSLCCSPFTRDPICATQWTTLLRSALATVLDVAKPGASPSEEEARTPVDQSILLLTVSLFIISSPKDVVFVPNILEPCSKVFRDAWMSKNSRVRLKCVQTVTSIYQHPDAAVSTPFIHAMAPLVLESLLNLESDQPADEQELVMIQEGIRMVETLVAVTPQQNRIQMLMVLVPLLVSFLSETSQLSSQTRLRRTLHDFALQKLVRIGPHYPVEFRSVMAAAPDLRTRLEVAVKAQQANQPSSKVKAMSASKSALPAVQKPTITLKTDFSNFTA